jgi:phosphatidylglycerol:prolipoprotein diacylglycerol transferase
MRRVLFQWGRIRIHSYPAMLYLGMVLGVVGGTYVAAVHGLNPARVYGAMLLLLSPALIGSRLLFAALHWDFYRSQPSRIWKRSDGGAALYGGLLLTLALSLPLLRAMGIAIAAFWDAAAVTILIGMIPTKFGCLLNGCCAGRPTERALALYLPNEQGVWRRRLPAQPMEAGLALILLVISIAVWRRFPFDGVLFLTASAGYGIGRWWLESTRENIDRVGSLNVHRAISAVLAAISMAGLALIALTVA